MRKVTQHTFMAFLLSAFLGTFASCSHDAEFSNMSDNEITLNVGFRMVTRASSGDGYEVGNTYENYIGVENGNYRIYFFDINNKFIARFEPSGFVVIEESNYRDYNILGKAPDAVAKLENFKIVMLANWPQYDDDAMKTGETDIDDICNAEWAQFGVLTDFSLNPAEKKLIPFYGVHEYANVKFKTGMITTLQEPVTLLRAMAKVEVILDTNDESGGFLTDASFSDVSVCRYNAKGYCAPSGIDSQLDYGQGNNWNTDWLPSLHLIGNKNDSENTTTPEERRLDLLCVDKRSDTKNEKWIAYLPEYDNSGDDYAYIEVTLDSQIGKSAPYKIYFSEYTDGVCDETKSFFNIARNNLYRFTVRIRNGKLQVIAEDWENTYDNDYTFE